MKKKHLFRFLSLLCVCVMVVGTCCWLAAELMTPLMEVLQLLPLLSSQLHPRLL